MNELSLHILDIAQNSIKAEATVLEIGVDTRNKQLLLNIKDNGTGMDEKTLRESVSPFATSRTTRKVGLGLPLLKMTAEMTGGCFDIKSAPGVGTTVTAVYLTDSVDCLPLGDMAESIILLVQQKPDNRFIYRRISDIREFIFDTDEIREVLGDVPLDNRDVLAFIKDFISEREDTMEVPDK